MIHCLLIAQDIRSNCPLLFTSIVSFCFHKNIIFTQVNQAKRPCLLKRERKLDEPGRDFLQLTCYAGFGRCFDWKNNSSRLRSSPSASNGSITRHSEAAGADSIQSLENRRTRERITAKNPVNGLSTNRCPDFLFVGAH